MNILGLTKKKTTNPFISLSSKDVNLSPTGLVSTKVPNTTKTVQPQVKNILAGKTTPTAQSNQISSSTAESLPVASAPVKETLASVATPKDTLIDKLTKASATASEYSPTKTYEELAKSSGLSDIQTQKADYNTKVKETFDMLDKLESDISARTSGMMVSDAQRRRILASEQAPITKELQTYQTGLESATEAEKTAKSDILTQMGLSEKEAGLPLETLKSEADLRTKIEALSKPTEEELDTFTDASGNRVAIMYDKTTGKTREIQLGKAQVSSSAGGLLTPTQGFDRELKLASDFEKYAGEARTAIRSIGTVNQGYEEAVKALKEGKGLNSQSQAVIIGFNKLIDPTSVVRESEYARTPEGQSLLNTLQGKIIKIQQGGAGMTKASLEEIKNTANALLQGYQKQMLNYAQRTQNQANNLKSLSGGTAGDLSRILTPDVLDVLSQMEASGSVDTFLNNAGY